MIDPRFAILQLLMEAQAWITLGVIALVTGLLALTRLTPYLVLFGGVAILLTLGVLSEEQLLKGVANSGTLTVGVLYAVACGIRETGAMAWAAGPLLGQPRTALGAHFRLLPPVAWLSAFMNNTPLVAVLMPVVRDWATKQGLSVSHLLIPLSYASILGGACTLIGTSTTLVVDGLVRQEFGESYSMGMFDIAKIGLPCAFAGLVFLFAFSTRLLPDRKPAISPGDDAREYVVEMMVESGGGLAGKTIEAAGLRQLPGLYLIEIEREGQVLAAVSSQVVLRDNDRLFFAGVVESVVDLQRIRGLVPATSQVFKLDAERINRSLVEAVVSEDHPIVGRSIRAGEFRTRYNAAVIAVARNGERIREKIGDIVLRAGDTLLLEARSSFASQHRNSRDFFLVSQVDDSAPIRHDKAGMSLTILTVMVVLAATGTLSMLNASILAAGAMIVARCTSGTMALRSIDWPVLLVIAAALALGEAMKSSGAAVGITELLIGSVGQSPHTILAVLCAVTMVFTNLINAKAAALLMFPIGISTAAQLGIDLGHQISPLPFSFAILIGAVSSYATPIGYPTNLMVMGPGGYRFSDYLRLGLPLSVLVWGISVWLIPVIWPF